jgi:hypothetical protein
MELTAIVMKSVCTACTIANECYTKHVPFCQPQSPCLYSQCNMVKPVKRPSTPQATPSVSSISYMSPFSSSVNTTLVSHPIVHCLCLPNHKLATHQLIHIGPLSPLVPLLLFLHQHSQNLNRRVQSQLIRAHPTLHACDSYSRLQSPH